LQELRDLNKPVIAAVNGICCGGGLEWALSADIILAADHASFALPEIRSGTVADAASIKVPKRIPYHIAMELLLTGRWFDVQEAKSWGLVNHSYPAEDLMAKAWDMARLLASGPPLVYAAIKEIVRDAEDSKFQDSMNRITQRQLASVDSPLCLGRSARGRQSLCRETRPNLEGQVTKSIYPASWVDRAIPSECNLRSHAAAFFRAQCNQMFFALFCSFNRVICIGICPNNRGPKITAAATFVPVMPFSFCALLSNSFAS
jgi:hypothetical protein